MRKYTIIIVVLLFVGFSMRAQQEEALIKRCLEYIEIPFVTDGQEYRALVSADEVAEFEATFYGGITYRLVACNDNLRFSIQYVDDSDNILFESSEFGDSPFWDFYFESTLQCRVQVWLNPDKEVESGFAIILIGFKE